MKKEEKRIKKNNKKQPENIKKKAHSFHITSRIVQEDSER